MSDIKKIIQTLRKDYPENKTALRHKSAYELLMSVILSAQCTDVRVNMVTPVLFAKYPTAAALAKAGQPDVEKIIRTTGFFRAKAKSLISSSRTITNIFGGKVPDNMKDLLTLRGVARKTANVVLSDWFKKAEGIVVDTHVKRLAYRMGLTKEKEPVKVEKDLMKKLDKKDWIFVGNALVWHGRKVCNARKPLCAKCSINKLCPKTGVKVST